MTDSAVEGPFDDPEPGDVPLPSAPLVRVLAQVRFPQFSQFQAEDEMLARRFAASVAAEYPLFEQGQEAVITITPEGVTSAPGGSKIWRLRSADGTWQVSFAHNFLSIETTEYVKRSEFTGRFQQAWEIFRSVVPPPFVDRLGIRYVNRVEDAALLGRLTDLVRPEVTGVVGVPSAAGQLGRALSEAVYGFADGSGFLGRWGMMPAEATLDTSIPPAHSPSWVLDMDSSREWRPGEYTGDGIGELSSDLALRAYQFFRWAVRPEFLTAFGGEVQ